MRRVYCKKCHARLNEESYICEKCGFDNTPQYKQKVIVPKLVKNISIVLTILLIIGIILSLNNLQVGRVIFSISLFGLFLIFIYISFIDITKRFKDMPKSNNYKETEGTIIDSSREYQGGYNYIVQYYVEGVEYRKTFYATTSYMNLIGKKVKVKYNEEDPHYATIYPFKALLGSILGIVVITLIFALIVYIYYKLTQ